MAQKTTLTLYGIPGAVPSFFAKTAAALPSSGPFYSGGALPIELTPVSWEILLQRFNGVQLFPLTPLSLEWDLFVSLNGLGSFSLMLDLKQ